ncbi:hypothetical protein GGX14DRAFT_677294 [Mycena pura]|uniref:Uncharacterized protein n=1 Tax=Mycena pura TaxID=153505 RepID=A0AAD6Y5M3_9AGAR|nr:hypothetical protein GGX14DRAFT_677294 [Mycena pura]
MQSSKALNKIHRAINRWVAQEPALRPLALLKDEWKMLDSLQAILKLFTEVTLQMSKASAPTLLWVLPMYEKFGLVKLEEYYEKARGCQFNVIATILHPSLGLSWFLVHGTERRDHAKTFFTHAYESYKMIYNEGKARERRAVQPQYPKRSGSSSSLLDDICGFADEDDAVLEDAAVGVCGPIPVVARMARDFLAIPGHYILGE